MTVSIIDIVQDIIGDMNSGESIFLQRDMLVGTVVEDNGCREDERGLSRCLTLERDSRRFTVELYCRQDSEISLIIGALVSEQSMQEYEAELQFTASQCGFTAGDRKMVQEKAGVVNYIRRYAPQLFNDNGEVIFGEFTAAGKNEQSLFWQRFILYAVLHGRAKAQRSSENKKAVFHTKLKMESAREPSFTEANQGAFMAALFFFLLLVGWFVWLRE